MYYPDESQFKYAEYTKPFIFKAFNYFNGKVNVFNSNVELSIVDSYSSTGICGESDWPGVILIYSMNILDDAKFIASSNNIGIIDNDNNINVEFDNLYKSLIISFIIHELFHADQIINKYNMNSSSNVTSYNPYTRKIEQDVYAMSWLYLNSNLAVIRKYFGFDIYTVENNGVISDDHVPYYRRLKEYDYYVQLFQSIFPESFFFKLPITNYLYNFPKIILRLNDDSILIKDHGEFIPYAIPYVSKLFSIISSTENRFPFDYKINTINEYTIKIALYIHPKSILTNPGRFYIEEEQIEN